MGNGPHALTPSPSSSCTVHRTHTPRARAHTQGAGGGAEHLSSTYFRGGAGGFVHGVLSVKEGEKYAIVVGDGGRSGNTPESNIKGYGFGGLGFCPSNAGGCTSAGCRNTPWENANRGREIGDGGGLAGIFKGGINKDNAIAIAGGGGGGSDSSQGAGATNDQGFGWNDDMAGQRGQSIRTGGGGAGYVGGKSESQRSVYGGSNWGGGLDTLISKNPGTGNDHHPEDTVSGGADDEDWEDSPQDEGVPVGAGGRVRTNCNAGNELMMGGPAMVKIYYVAVPPSPPPFGHNFTYVLEQLAGLNTLIVRWCSLFLLTFGEDGPMRRNLTGQSFFLLWELRPDACCWD